MPSHPNQNQVERERERGQWAYRQTDKRVNNKLALIMGKWNCCTGKTSFPCLTGFCEHQIPLSVLKEVLPSSMFSKVSAVSSSASLCKHHEGVFWMFLSPSHSAILMFSNILFLFFFVNDFLVWNYFVSMLVLWRGSCIFVCVFFLLNASAASSQGGDVEQSIYLKKICFIFILQWIYLSFFTFFFHLFFFIFFSMLTLVEWHIYFGHLMFVCLHVDCRNGCKLLDVKHICTNHKTECKMYAHGLQDWV